MREGQAPHPLLTFSAGPRVEATNKGQAGSTAGSISLASPEGLPILPREFQWTDVPCGRGHGLLEPLSPLPYLSPSRDSSVLVLLFTLMESGLKHKTGGGAGGHTGTGGIEGRHREGQRGLCQYGGGVNGQQGKTPLDSLMSPE